MRCSLLILLLLGLVACSRPADKMLQDYEQSLCRADSLVQVGAVDSTLATHLLVDLRREYNQIKTLTNGELVRMMPLSRKQKILTGVVIVSLSSLVIWLIFFSVDVKNEREHRSYTLSLNENEESLLNNERAMAELEAYLADMPLTDELREEVRESLATLLIRNGGLRQENDALRIRLKEYEKRPIPRELELLKERGERIRLLDNQVQSLTSILVDRDEVVDRLRRFPKYLQDADWEYLQQLTNQVYNDFTQRLLTRFPQITDADLQLCLLVRLRFSNAQVAILTAVSPASVSQQKFRLKKRLMQTEEGLFDEGETVDKVIGCV